MHDFDSIWVGSVHGVYDYTRPVGQCGDTTCAVESIRRWWRGIGALPERHSAADNGWGGRGIGSACGSWSCRNWRMRRASNRRVPPQGPASGTRSNTACSPAISQNSKPLVSKAGAIGAAGSEPTAPTDTRYGRFSSRGRVMRYPGIAFRERAASFFPGKRLVRTKTVKGLARGNSIAMRLPRVLQPW